LIKTSTFFPEKKEGGPLSERGKKTPLYQEERKKGDLARGGENDTITGKKEKKKKEKIHWIRS